MLSDEAVSASSNLIRSTSNSSPNPPNPNKRKRSLPGTPDPTSEVIALSPKSLMTTNRFICEVCNKGFKRDQNLQLHLRGHNLPWKLKQRNHQEVIRKKVYVCPEKSCVHHDPCRALGDLTGIKKHFSRKHGEKKWKCDKCSKKYAVQSDWKAHSKICGTREYRCDCGTLFSRKDSFLTHRAFCESLVERSARIIGSAPAVLSNFGNNLLINNTQAQAPRIPHGLFGLNQEFGGPVPETFMGNFLNNNPQHHQMNIPHHNYLPSNSTTTTSVFSSSEANSDLELLQTNMNSFGSIPHGQWMNYRYPEQQEVSMPMLTQGVLKLEQEENNKMHDLSHLYYQNQLQGGLQGGPSHAMESTTRKMNNGNNSAPPNIVEIKKLFKQGNHAGNLNEDQLSLTRDFLGVGVGDDSLKKPLLQQEVPRFNPIGPIMNMQSDQFGGHY
ncbi:unnamed protein product [Vicia faba]|uniref:C2H2-type domain-containing protein n=1 Tax=Vicia faba TaxID=3906 RepID=A0AAV0Z1X6_VICFA|nr:unnamed protein product [Vicia faba]